MTTLTANGKNYVIIAGAANNYTNDVEILEYKNNGWI